MWERGQITMMTQVCEHNPSNEGRDDWMAASDVMWLFEESEPILSSSDAMPEKNRPSVDPKKYDSLLASRIDSGIYRVLTFFFGLIGVNNFYAGEITAAVVKLLVGPALAIFLWFLFGSEGGMILLDVAPGGMLILTISPLIGVWLWTVYELFRGPSEAS
jgi:hypothetical protein